MRSTSLRLLAVFVLAANACGGVAQEPTPGPVALPAVTPEAVGGNVATEPMASGRETGQANTARPTIPRSRSTAQLGGARGNSAAVTVGTQGKSTPDEEAFQPTPEVSPSSSPQTPSAGSKTRSQQIFGPISEVQDSLTLLESFVFLDIVVTLICTLLLLRRLPRRKSSSSSREGGGEFLPSSDMPSIPQDDEGLLQTKGAALEPPAPVVPKAAQAPVDEKPRSPQPPALDEYTDVPHGPIGRALSQLHQAVPELARKLSDPRQQERFLADFDEPLRARIDRFRSAVRQGDGFLKEHWIEQDLVTTLNTLAQLLSSVIKERHRGRRGNRLLEDELLRWLYERLAPVCRDEGWFSIEPILPFTTKFDPKIHYSVGSEPLEGADNLIVEIKAIGRRDPGQKYVTHKAEVIVGR